MKTSKHPTLANGQPAISCLHLSLAEYERRDQAAADRFVKEYRAHREASPTAAEEAVMEEAVLIARSILWHPDFTQGFRLAVCDTPLYRLTVHLPSRLVEANGGEPLDFWDYGYVADVLRELLSRSGETKGDRLSLHRALAWVEEQGGRLRDYGQEV